MITFEKARKIVEDNTSLMGIEEIDFMDSLGRVLVEDVTSDIDMPPFNKSAMDGYACRKQDLDKELTVNEIIPAGVIASKPVESGECVKIMTGAAIPPGADWVFRVEDAIESGLRVKFTGMAVKDNIARKGEDIVTGDTVLRRGRLIKPQDIAVMATVGATRINVSRKPKVAVISTGNELIEPSQKPGPGQIRNSNAYQLINQVIRSGGEAIYYGISVDDKEVQSDMISMAIDECEIVLLTGGVSMGDFDLVPDILRNLGVKILFDRVAVQPGKPTTFGIHRDAIIFGLPGNPVSSFVQFELFVRPMIQRSMSNNWHPVISRLPMSVVFTRKSDDRLLWVPVKINNNNEVQPVEYHGSAHINALPEADGLISVPVGISTINKGKLVDVRQI